MNTGYLIYQAERPLSRGERQQVDIAHAEIARKVSRRWQALTAPLRALRRAGNRSGRQPGYLAAEYPAAERLTECQAEYRAGECLPGRAA
jgi:hypothetical protein